MRKLLNFIISSFLTFTTFFAKAEQSNKFEIYVKKDGEYIKLEAKDVEVTEDYILRADVEDYFLDELPIDTISSTLTKSNENDDKKK